MRVVSKFLTADVRLIKMSLAGRKLVVEGTVKEMMPMTVELSLEDVRASVRLGAKLLADLVLPRLPLAVQGMARRMSILGENR